MRTAITANPHDNGWDLVHGPQVNGNRFGTVFWDDSSDGTGEPGLVLQIDTEDADAFHNGDSSHYPEGVDEVVRILAVLGWDLSSESRDDVSRLIPA